jgi:hypothetical protein
VATASAKGAAAAHTDTLLNPALKFPTILSIDDPWLKIAQER